MLVKLPPHQADQRMRYTCLAACSLRSLGIRGRCDNSFHLQCARQGAHLSKVPFCWQDELEGTAEPQDGSYWAHSLNFPEKGCLLIAHPLMFTTQQRYFAQVIIMFCSATRRSYWAFHDPGGQLRFLTSICFMTLIREAWHAGSHLPV